MDGAGRPREANKYSKDGSARGRDPLGAHNKKVAYGAVAKTHYETMYKHMGEKAKTMLTESSEVEEEYNSEVSSLNTNKN